MDMGRVYKWQWEWEWLLFHVCQNSHRSTRCECSVSSLPFLNSNMWHFVVCWRQYDTDSTRFLVEILKLRQLSFCILNVLHFDYSTITDNMTVWGEDSWVFAFWTLIVWSFSDKCRVRREWQWEGMGINSDNWTGMGIKSEASWEWEWTDGNGRERGCCKPFPQISSTDAPWSLAGAVCQAV